MWSLKRKIFIFSIVVIIFSSISLGIYFHYFQKKPTCFDGIQNGDEQGVDCGGSCEQPCFFQADDLIIYWSQVFPVTDTVSNLGILVENPNFNYKITATFNIRVFDDRKVRIFEKRQTANFLPMEKRVIFIPSLRTEIIGDKKAWVEIERINSLTISEHFKQEIFVLSKNLEVENNLSRLEIDIKNRGIKTRENIEIIAILNDGQNAINIGRSFVENIKKRESKNVIMTWPIMFEENINEDDIEIFIRTITNEELQRYF